MSVASLLSLDGKVALVTGAAGGIGSAVVRLLLGAGARVVAVDLPGRAVAEGAVGMACDLREPVAVRGVVARVEEIEGRLDVLVHGAGIARDAVLWKMSEEAWEEVLAVNLDSAFHLLKAAVPLMRRTGGGAIVLVSSINGERGRFGLANYAASKAGLIALGKTAAAEVGRFGIRVNSVAPGWIDTPMTAALPEEHRRQAIESSLLGRVGTPEDVARVVLFLCSDLSRHVTGQVVRVDGGQLTA